MNNEINLLITLTDGTQLLRVAIKITPDMLEGDVMPYYLEPENKAQIAKLLPEHCKSGGYNIVEVKEIFEIKDLTYTTSIAQALAEERSKAWEGEAVKQAYIQGRLHALAEEREKVGEKVVVYVSRSSDHGDLSHEARLKLNAEECEIYLADTADGVWGDDWNDAPDDCNSGTPYKETMKGFIKMKVKLGQPLLPLSLTPPTDKPLPDRE